MAELGTLSAGLYCLDTTIRQKASILFGFQIQRLRRERMIAQHGQGSITTHTGIESGSRSNRSNIATGADISGFGVSIIIREQSWLVPKMYLP